MKNKTLVDYSYKRIAKQQQKTQGKTKNNKSKLIFGILLVLLVAGSFIIRSKFWKSSSMTVLNSAEEQQQEAEKDEDQNIKNYVVKEGDIPADIFCSEGKLDANDVQELLAACDGVYDLTKLKIGHNLDFVFGDEDKVQKIKYYPNTEDVVVVENSNDGFEVREEKIPYKVQQETLHVVIDEFLYKDALDEGLSEASILEIADIFSFDVDFTTEIREGDELKVIYEKRTLNGESAPDGKILAAKFTNAGESYFGYYFESDGEGSHYDREGHELRRQFLRAPLSYRKITSGYTGARLHPITKTVSAHYQIDYAAPVGTPVVATARGTVSSAGWEGGWGNMVRLAHDNGYTTHYGHLSAYGEGIRSGVSVSQGQVVGYVGSTGWSTGPHLDYGMKLNGSPINPLSLKLPKGEPLSGDQLEKFLQEKQKYDREL